MTEQERINWVNLVLLANVPAATMKHVLLTIAALCNRNGKCRPSIARLAKLSGFDRRTITRNLKKLEKDCWLYIERVGTPHSRETNFYELNYIKLHLEKVSLESGGTMPLPEAQNPYEWGAESPNTKTPAPRPTAAPKAQAGGSGAGSSVKENIDANGDSQLWDFLDDETETSPFEIESIEPEAETAQPVAIENPFAGREYITRAEADRALELGISPFELPEIQDESD